MSRTLHAQVESILIAPRSSSSSTGEEMIKSAAQIGGLLLAFWPVTSNAQIEMPPLLVGEWRNNTLVERDGGDCTEMGRARGITITEDGKISAHRKHTR